MTNRCIWIQKGELVMDDDPAVVTKAYHGYTKRMAQGRYEDGAKYLEEVRHSYVPETVVWA
jgi:teichoic acid transport system ATP-binding protein